MPSQRLSFVLVLVLLLLAMHPAAAHAQVSRDQRYSQFKRDLWPSWTRGADGYLSAPRAGTLGRGRLALAWDAAREGRLTQPDGRGTNTVFRSNFSAFYGWKPDVDLGLTHKTLFESDLGQDRLNLEARVWTLRARAGRLRDLAALLLFPLREELEGLDWPGQAPFDLAVGLDYTDLTENGWDDTDSFLDYHVVGTRGFSWLGRDLDASAGWRSGIRGDLRSQPYPFTAAGVALPWNMRADLEYVGTSERRVETGAVQTDDTPILNLGLSWERRIRAEGRGSRWLDGGSVQVGADLYNLTRSMRGVGFDPSGERVEWGLHVGFVLPLGGPDAPVPDPDKTPQGGTQP